MKRFLTFLMLFLSVLAMTGAFYLWQNRPGRAVLTVNGRHLTAQELAWRAETLLQDAQRQQHFAFTADRAKEVRQYYRREAARLWLIKEIFLATAVARGMNVTPADEQSALALAGSRLKHMRGMTSEQYFSEGPLPRAVKERDFREGVLVNKFTKSEIEDKIKITGEEIKKRTDELVKINLATAKPGKEMRHKTDHKSVVTMLRGEKYAQGFRELLASLYGTVVVKSPEFPQFETFEGLSAPSRRAAVFR